MELAYRILLAFGLVVAVLYGTLVLLTGKGDAMSGGGSGVRTTFKGKASFDDYMARLILGLGTALFVLLVLLNVVADHMKTH